MDLKTAPFELLFVLFAQHQSYLVEAWYMLHSVASEVEYVCSLNRTLQRLINEELSRTFRPVKEDDERTVGCI